ncbi:DUF3823 domain-containing protein [Sphingobacterium yanglingense]|uniref:Uncharacterized protein DUF3823 n=1 Tax=Sphingobacterium yanglingense TaxID=1437280 RepID=A0A4R6W882_9SPHI|nr:DUF3823 domain-containing protein [Sphingobacterium yanglingense]TDQ73472.1 uncharacterized protein DUF3823 [Sphingobacterium yanglingense]
MNTRNTFKIVALSVVLLLASCGLNEIDNYEGPNASIYGAIYDAETKELIQQDIVRGAQIEYVEHGYANPQTQYMVIKNDGTYQNKLMFANTYTIRAVRGNFVPSASQEIKVSGNTTHNFEVIPYVRIKNPNISQQGNKIIATFDLDKTVDNSLQRIGLFAHSEINVGEPLHKVSAQQTINGPVDEGNTYHLEIDLTQHSTNLMKGKSYYFRIGALMNASEAKFNYAPALRITIQ